MKFNVNPSSSWKEWFDQSAKYNDDPRLKMAYQINGKPVSMEIIQATINDVYTKLNPLTNSKILDVGGGVGYFAQIFKQKLKSVVTTDISFNMLKSGKKLFNGSYFVCESSFLPFTNSSFDRVLCYSVFHYLGTPDHAKNTILEFARVINNKGLILIGDVPLEQKSIKKRKNAKIPSRHPEFLRHNLKTLTFDPKFFEDLSVSHNFECKILKQNINGKITSAGRFDVLLRISK